jgi:taurine dioxygenase
MGLSVGPCTHLAAERQRLAGLQWRHFDVEPQGVTLGGLITGVDLTSDLPDAVIDEIRRALFEYKVIFFRDQDIDLEQQKAFGRRFGKLHIHPTAPSAPGHPEVLVVRADETRAPTMTR